MGGKRAPAAAPAHAPQARSQARRENSSTRMLSLMGVGALVAFVAGFLYNALPSASPAGPLPLHAGRHDVACAAGSYASIGSCSPPRACARIVVDDFLSAGEVGTLRALADLGMGFGEGAGGPTVFDTISGAASAGERFHDAYKLMERRLERALASGTAKEAAARAAIPSPAQVALYRSTAARVKALLERELGVQGLYLTSPSFFSRITPKPAKTEHDAYWHEHIDQKQYGSFTFTALLYLSEQGRHFEGGSFLFVDAANATHPRREWRVQPKTGRLSLFTSGPENVHYVSRVTSGVRHALTIAFTCDKSKSVEDTLLSKADAMSSKLQRAVDSEQRASEASQPTTLQTPSQSEEHDTSSPQPHAAAE